MLWLLSKERVLQLSPYYCTRVSFYLTFHTGDLLLPGPQPTVEAGRGGNEVLADRAWLWAPGCHLGETADHNRGSFLCLLFCSSLFSIHPVIHGKYLSTDPFIHLSIKPSIRVSFIHPFILSCIFHPSCYLLIHPLVYFVILPFTPFRPFIHSSFIHQLSFPTIKQVTHSQVIRFHFSIQKRKVLNDKENGNLPDLRKVTFLWFQNPNMVKTEGGPLCPQIVREEMTPLVHLYGSLVDERLEKAEAGEQQQPMGWVLVSLTSTAMASGGLLMICYRLIVTGNLLNTTVDIPECPVCAFRIHSVMSVQSKLWGKLSLPIEVQRVGPLRSSARRRGLYLQSCYPCQLPLQSACDVWSYVNSLTTAWCLRLRTCAKRS